MINNELILVPKDQFYEMIGSLERVDHGAELHHHPEKVLRWYLRQWINGDYQEVACTETLMDRPYPYPINHYVSARLVRLWNM